MQNLQLDLYVKIQKLSVNPNMIAAGGGQQVDICASSANIDKFDNKNENLKISSRPML